METNKPTEAQIRERAFALWEQEGQPEGRAEEYWHRAVHELEAQEAEPGNELPQKLADEVKPMTVPE